MTKKKRFSIETFFHSPPPAMKAFYIFAGIVLVGFGATLLAVAVSPLPDLDTLSTRKISESTRIYDRTGNTVLHDLNPDVTRDLVKLDEVSQNIIDATLAVEDSSFYSHNGISITGTLRAIIYDVMTGTAAQGGSTITQQVIKNTLLTNDKSIIRKVHEWVLALKLERQYSKNQILELYFNNTPYGGTLYGIEAATYAFFGKSAKDVSLAEAAYLAALPQAPTYFSPYGNNKDALEKRKNFVLERMRILGMITKEQYDGAIAEEVVFSPQTNNSIIAPHFVFYIEQYLEQKYGPTAVTQGLEVTTTLDVDMQRIAEETVLTHALQNVKNFHAENAALVAMDPKTGQILSMVGSRDYFDPDIDGNYNIALAERQPGSSFKPFVYATALSKGYTPDTIIFDLPTQFSTACAPADIFNKEYPCYAPGNYDDKFRGPMTFTTAIAQSINVPAVKVLYLAGIDNVIDLATHLGITTLGEAKEYGLSLALGAAEVRLLDMVSAYGAFANNGIKSPTTGILMVKDSEGNILEEYKDAPEQVLDAGVAHDISYMLSNNEARFPEYPPNNPFNFPGFDVAAKTGTTNDSRDAWTIGYTPNIVVGVWAGNNDNSPMVKEIAGYIVAPMWHDFMQYALDNQPQEFFPERRAIPEGAPAALKGVYSDNTGIHDILYWVNKDNPLIGGGSRNDAQYKYWEYALSAAFGKRDDTQTDETSSEATPQDTQEDN